MTRILYLIKSLGRGGAERLLVDIALRLDRARFLPEIAFTLDAQAELASELETADLPVIHLGKEGSRVQHLWNLQRLLRRSDYDIVHVHSPAIASIARLLPRQRKTRLIYTEHNEWPAYHPITRWVNAATYWRNDHVFTVSDQVRQSARYPGFLRFVPTPVTTTLYHGVNLHEIRTSLVEGPVRRATFEIPDDALVVGTVANFRPEKGHKILVKAASQVLSSVDNAHFVLVGGGPLEQVVRQQVATAGLTNNFTFTGYREDAIDIATLFDVLSLPSFHEGLPIALLEAMALGKPVVATAAGGIPEVVQHGQQGLLVPTGNDEALAQALITMLTDSTIRARMSKGAAQRAEDFDIVRAVSLLEKIYESRAD